MTEDASLSDFAGDDGAADDAPRDDPDGADDAPVDTRDGGAVDVDDDHAGADDGAEAPGATYAWGEYACSRCGRSSERVWREDGAFVCPDCKRW